MARGKRYQPEQVVNLLRQIDVAVANGKTTAQACGQSTRMYLRADDRPPYMIFTSSWLVLPQVVEVSLGSD
jgi:hypothetical protein